MIDIYGENIKDAEVLTSVWSISKIWETFESAKAVMLLNNRVAYWYK